MVTLVEAEGPRGPKFKIKYADKPTKLEDGSVIVRQEYYERWFERGMFYIYGPERRRIGDPWVYDVGIHTS